ncbi:APC family permease [Streptococcus ovuberis]|uniref:APC family permease n=1 Tax=Streptococcus ovuberis TaxID=1936207 RepID=A0A7X6N101_9STRE|nr:APC family permease [Streptococcus ovuberis]NKZ21056.1 APC family permease [Streptococcus ovuberis]
MEKITKQAYNLWTAIALIVGVVIGSGIYFKADDILTFTGGHVGLGILVLVLGSLSVTFGSLSLSELAQRNSGSGGLSSYFEAYVNPGLAAALGFFTAYLYFPTVIAVVAWVAGIYTFLFLGIDASLGGQILLGAAYVIVFGSLNIYSRHLGGYFQTLSTMIKVIPLILIGFLGLFHQTPTPEIPATVTIVEPHAVGIGWMAGLVPLAFAFEGWTAVANIAPEIKNPKKNLARAFIIGPMSILGIYLLFFYGMNNLLGPSFIMSTGDKAITFAGVQLFGAGIGKLLLLVVLLSVLGVVNGLILATMRLPQAFAERGWIPSPAMAKLNLKYQLSIPAAVSVIIVTLAYLFIHYLVQKFNLLPGSDISEITLVFNNVTLNLLHLAVLRHYLKGKITNKLTGLLAPVLAMAGSLMILIGSLTHHFVRVACFQLFCLLFCAWGYWLYRKTK